MAVLYYRDLAKNQWIPLVIPTVIGTSDHGSLVGLGDDDHPNYLNVARGDARYTQIGHTHPYAPSAHSHAIGDLPTSLATEAEVSGAIGAHAGQANPHSQYALAADVPTKTGVGATGTWPISITGNAPTATTASKLATPRTIALSGDVSGSTTFDGSANATIVTTVADDSHNHNSLFTAGSVAYYAGWGAYSLTLARSGNIVSFNALLKRTGANLALSRNVNYQVCTVPAGFRPAEVGSAAGIVLTNSSPAWALARFSFELSGTVQFMVNPATGINTNSWVLVSASWRAQ